MDTLTLFADIRAKSKMLHHLKSRRDRGGSGSKNVNDALAIQKAERELKRLRDALPPLRLVAE